MEEILNIQKDIIFDESIAHYEIHTHQPFASSTYNNNDEIRISVQHQDLFVLPSRSALHVYGRLTKPDGTAAPANTKFVNNGICHLFEDIRYELNGIVIDQCKNVGITSLMKNLVSLSPNQKYLMANAGWFKENEDNLTNPGGYFNVSIPLNFLLGFAEDYRKIIINAKHELILTRSSADTNAIQQPNDAAAAAAEQYKITIMKIEWMMPYVKASDHQKIKLLKFISTDAPISISFRTWELYEYPLLPVASKQVWVVKTSSQLEKPRYAIVGFQTNRKNNSNKNASSFDHCKIRDIKLILNSQSYPYGNLNLDIARNQSALLYDMYANFQSSYYGKDPEPFLDKSEYILNAPLIVIDCSKQNESLKSGPVDIRLEFESTDPFPANTSAYCLILHDRVVEYNPISNSVKKLV